MKTYRPRTFAFFWSSLLVGQLFAGGPPDTTLEFLKGKLRSGSYGEIKGGGLNNALFENFEQLSEDPKLKGAIFDYAQFLLDDKLGRAREKEARLADEERRLEASVDRLKKLNRDKDEIVRRYEQKIEELRKAIEEKQANIDKLLEEAIELRETHKLLGLMHDQHLMKNPRFVIP